jgi:hypothetical protein
MLVIRERHKAAFDKAVAANLECSLYTHVTRMFPSRCEEMGEPAVRQLIRRGIEAAGAYGIEGEYDVSRFVDLMFVLGSDFDAGASWPWAGAILQDARLTGPEKMDRLCDRARDELADLRAGRAERT